MSALLDEAVLILGRHGQTRANAARLVRSSESRVLGVGIDMPLDSEGERQAQALGRGLGEFVTRRNLNVVAVHSSDARRAVDSRDLALETIELELPVLEPDDRLREICKGNLEGELYSEAYPDEIVRQQAAIDWNFRHGTGETAYEAGERWLQWFHRVVEPCYHSKLEDNSTPTVIAFGHSLVTCYGLWMLLNPDKLSQPPSLRETEKFRVDNGTALTLVRSQSGQWRHAEEYDIKPSPLL